MATLREIEHALGQMSLDYIDHGEWEDGAAEVFSALCKIQKDLEAFDLMIETAKREQEKLLQSADQYIK